MILVLVGFLTVGLVGLIGVIVYGSARSQRERPARSARRSESGSLAGFGAGVLVSWAGLCVVPAGHVGIVHKRFGKSDPDPRFKQINPHNARGTQARTLLPGRPYWLNPFAHSVEFVPRVHVPAGEIGLVVATEGAKRDPGRALGQAMECDNFQDGAAFLRGGGEQGRQLAILRGDSSYYINTALFHVTCVPRTYVEPGTVGLVIAKDGAIRPPNRPFGRYVECDNFQDGAAFLRGGGEQGRQLAILTGGTYYDINPYLFEVLTTSNVDRSGRGGSGGLGAEQLKEIKILDGHTGVVIALDGAEPDRAERKAGPIVTGHSSFRLPWVFLERGGWRGVQEETLGEGSVYALNPWFVRIVLIPTRVLILDWSNKRGSQSDNNYDAALDRITVNVQGHRLQVELRQTLYIPEKVAPQLVSEFGDSSTYEVGGLVNNPAPVQRFVERVLGGAVDTYFNGIAAESTVDEFLTGYASIRTDLTAQVRNALAAWGVEAASTNLGEFESLDGDLDKARKRVFEAQTRTQELEEQKKNALIRAAIRDIELATERKEVLVGLARLEETIRLVGVDTVRAQRLLEHLKDIKVPQVVSGDAESLLKYLPMQRALELIDGAKRHTEQSALPPSAPDDEDLGLGGGGTE